MTEAVSVIIPVRNGERFLGEAIATVAAQTHAVDEIVVVDDGSTDSTREIALESGARYLTSAGRGSAITRNTGAAAARSPLLAFLDHDDLWMPDKLERQLERLAVAPDLGFVTTRVRVRVEPGATLPSWFRGDLTAWSGAIGSTVLVRAPVLNAVGGFNPAFKYADDYDWLLRTRDAGFSGDELATPLAEHRVHGMNHSHDREPVTAELMVVLRASMKRRVRQPDAADRAGA